jgi:diguanylate cyclase (GGDEF)-like protein
VLELQNIILEMVAKGEPLEATASRLCAEVEKRLPGIVCSILRVDRAGLLHPLAGPSLPETYSAALDGLAIGPDVGSCGSAAFLRKPVAVVDIESDRRWAPYRDLVRPLGFKACWSSPIADGHGRVIGTFAFYYFVSRGPTEMERRIVDTCVHLCAIALERHERVLDRERKAYIDALTELANRACFDKTLARLSCDKPGAWGLLLIDLDNLKLVNDTFGHHVGDKLLQAAATRIAETVAPDVVFRLGGDEFAVLVQGHEAVLDLDAMSLRIRAALTKPADCDQRVIVPTATLGAAVVSRRDTSAEAVHRNADFALYHAKETDRGGFVRYTPHLDTTMTHRVNCIRSVGAALTEGRIDAYYQPIVRLDSRAIIGVEALCRLITNNGDVVPAAAFHEATSDARVASELTRRMLSITATDVRTWLKMGIPFQQVCINVASADFHCGKLKKQIAEAFERENVALDHVTLEVTESVYMHRGDQVVAREIGELRAMGVRVALDDFGTGFASLTDLLTSPVDILKIDKSFVDQLAVGSRSAIIVEGLLEIARRLGIHVVAEGIETEDQSSQLQAFGCSVGQGFLFSKAAPRDQAAAMLLHSAERPGSTLKSIIADGQTLALRRRNAALA